MYSLGRDRVVEIIGQRASAVAAQLALDQAALAAAETAGVPPVFLSEHRYQVALRHAEQAWLVNFAEELRAGVLGWPTRPEGS
jgi:ABC-type cobalamin transport system ATPase subunit